MLADVKPAFSGVVPRRGDELLVLLGREITDPRGVGGLVGVDLLRERVAPLGDDRAHVRGEHPHVRHQGGGREDEHRPGVVGAAVGEHRILHEVWERENHARPQRERVRAVLDPRASPELHERRDRARGRRARGQHSAVRLLAVQDRGVQEESDHGRPVLRARRVPHHRARALRRQGQVLPRRPHPRDARGAGLRARLAHPTRRRLPRLDAVVEGRR